MHDHDEAGVQSLVHNDAFSSGQVGSKLWLCEELERELLQRASHRPKSGERVWIYGGWQGVLGFLLLARRGFTMERIRSFDVDPTCAPIANMICDNWNWQSWLFRAFTLDCNHLDPVNGGDYGSPPTVVINTAVEHFEQRDWFEKIPKGTTVVLQASNFDHDGAVAKYEDEMTLAKAFPLTETWACKSLDFNYENWGFTRSMLIGVR